MQRFISFGIVFSIVLLASSCSVVKKQSLKRNLSNSDFFNSHFTGFILQDPNTNEILFEYNADKYFIPASNTKLLTYFSTLVSLEDSLPGLRYETIGDTLYFSGVGDPTFLHPDFSQQPTFDFLKNSNKTLVYVEADFIDAPHAEGWMWDDYSYYFQPERSSFPIYGNSVIFDYNIYQNEFEIIPGFFKDYVDMTGNSNAPARHYNTNIFNFKPDTSRSDYKNRIPFKTSEELFTILLEDTLNMDIIRTKRHNFISDSILYTQKTKDVCRYMLKKSDNFFAEQLLYSTAVAQNIRMNSSIVRNFIRLKYFDTVSGKPKWKDGSGLSRYNLMTPRFMVDVLSKIEENTSIAEMKSILPTGGVDGTIKDWYEPENGESPYVFAKTGTLSNNHNLTGIITTRMGNDYFFSFMNNNYPTTSYPVKMQMEKVLRIIYENY